MNLNLKIRRIQRSLSQKDLAEIIGVTSQSISDYERGKTIPSYDNMVKISKALETPVQDLFF